MDRPLWATMAASDQPDSEGPRVAVVVVEAFHALFKRAQDLMEMIAEPKSRTSCMHMYKLTENSLYTAISLGMSGDDVITRLEELAKRPLTDDIKEYIVVTSSRAGKVRLVLDTKRVTVRRPDTFKMMGQGKARQVVNWATKFVLTNFIEVDQDDDAQRDILRNHVVRTQYMIPGTLVNEGTCLRFEVPSEASTVELKRYFKETLRYPLDSVYAFANDTSTADVTMKLSSTTRLRPYQSLTLSKTIGQGKARSGLVVLPCGAGKTLVGVATSALIGKATVVVCLNTLTVKQWWEQFRKWTNVSHKQLTIFTADKKEPPGDIVITTYSMLGFPDDRRAEGSPELVNKLREKEWGLMLMDEVHVAPAATFRRILDRVRAHCIVGLTATLLREDDRIHDLHYLIGPKLYEANWRELCSAGYLADVMAIEVLCPMRGPFFDAYLKEGGARRGRIDILPIMNPTKLHVTQALIHFHRQRGDKILLFSDTVRAVDYYARFLHVPQIVGDVPERERYCIINHFKFDATVYCLALSSAAETGTDVPDANVIIQISGMFGSQRQEAQRLGRILRAKHGGQGNCGWFYSLVSKDTREPNDHARRRTFLQEQGYAFKVIAADDVIQEFVADGGQLETQTAEAQEALLGEVYGTAAAAKEPAADAPQQAWKKRKKL
eukprot:TRINITY_DN24737_c0_g1_i1.p1 TRINITY_DN24737_c0_g1~~TRINITY_DN24737_c0_g1_i1.p1  ORF type:complete len:664 (+),score=269.26 TRINITY_DN24737_c0_g1_i1:126-2117(+)